MAIRRTFCGLLASVLLGVCSSGCATVITLYEGRITDRPSYLPHPDLIYSGVRTDIYLVAEVPWLGLQIGAVLDIPFSFVLDTVALPVTAVLRLFAEPRWDEPTDAGLQNIAEHNPDPEVRAGAEEEIRRRALKRASASD